MITDKYQFYDNVNQNIDDDLTASVGHIRRMTNKVVNKPLGMRVKAAREAAGLTQSQLADGMGVKQSAIAEIEGGRVRRPKGLHEISQMTGKSIDWLLGKENDHLDSMDIAADEVGVNPDASPTVGSETGRRGVPKDVTIQLDVTAGMGGGGLTIISDGVPGRNGMTFSAEHVRDYWRLPPELLTGMGMRANDVIVLPVQGDSMAPTLVEGEYVFVDTRHRLPSPDGLYALADDYGGLVIKRLETLGVRDDEMWVKVVSDNPRHAEKERPLSDTRIIGRVVRRFGVIG